jgi:hypothetical protein
MRSTTPLECRENPASSPIALHNLVLRIIRDGAQDVHLELPGRRRGVDTLGEADERDTEGLKILR